MQCFLYQFLDILQPYIILLHQHVTAFLEQIFCQYYFLNAFSVLSSYQSEKSATQFASGYQFSNILVLIPVYTFRDLSWNQLNGSIPTNRLASNITTMYVAFDILLEFCQNTANFYVLAVIYHITFFKELFHQPSQGYLIFSSCKYYLIYRKFYVPLTSCY